MKKAIIVVSFGSSYEETLNKNIGRVEADIAKAFKGVPVRRAFTSSMIIRKLRDREVIVDSPKDAIERLVKEGFTDILLQPLHIIPGFEYEKIEHAVDIARREFVDVKFNLSTPLMYRYDDYVNLLDSLNEDIPKKDKHAYIFMGHGTEHQSNASYSQLQNMWSDRRKDVLIANVEGYPQIDDILRNVKRNYMRVTLIPLMIVAGDHAINDMSSDDDGSFKSILSDSGLEVECELIGLGEREAVRGIFVDKIKHML